MLNGPGSSSSDVHDRFGGRLTPSGSSRKRDSSTGRASDRGKRGGGIIEEEDEDEEMETEEVMEFAPLRPGEQLVGGITTERSEDEDEEDDGDNDTLRGRHYVGEAR